MTSSFPIVCSAVVVANRKNNNKNNAFFASFSSSSSHERRKTSSSKVFPIGASKSSGNSNATTTRILKTPSKTTIQTRRKGTTRRRASSDDAFQFQEEEEEEKEEEESNLFYPARLDVVPAFVGGLNPVNSFLFYFSGAVLTQGTVKTTTQWTLFVVLPILFVMYLVRKWRYEGDVERRILLSASSGDDGRNSGSSGSGSSNDDKTSSSGGANNARTTKTMEMMSYSRSMRGRWLDVHVCYAFLLPAGISAGEHSSYWLVLAPAFMLYRFLCREERVTKSSGEDFNATTTTTKRPLLFSSSSSSPFFAFLSPVGRGWSALALILRRAHKYAKIVLASLALALLVASGSATLHQSLTALSGGGMALRVLLSPFAIGVAFLGYFAPAALLPRYISRVFSRKVISADEEEATRKARLTKEERVELETKRETEKKNRKWWLLIGFIAMGISAFTGSDLPIVLAFAAQLLKANPDALLTAMAEKGGMVEFETKIADAFDRVVLSKKERERERDENENESENETGAK